MAPAIFMPLGTKALADGKTLIGSPVRLTRPQTQHSNPDSLTAEERAKAKALNKQGLELLKTESRQQQSKTPASS